MLRIGCFLCFVLLIASLLSGVALAQHGSTVEVVFEFNEAQPIYMSWFGERLVLAETLLVYDKELVEQNLIRWYEYNPEEGNVRQLSSSPYLNDPLSQETLDGLTNMVTLEGGRLPYIAQSPSGDKLIYPCQDEFTRLCVFLVSSGISLQMDVVNSVSTFPFGEVLWSQDETVFIVQNYPVPNPFIVTFQDSQVNLEWLTHLPVCAGCWYEWTEVVGLSPSGKYILMSVMWNGAEYWLYDRDSQTSIHLPDLGKSGGKAFWIDDKNFIVDSRQGIVWFNIDDENYVVMVEQELIPCEIAYALLPSVYSSDGQFLFVECRNPAADTRQILKFTLSE